MSASDVAGTSRVDVARFIDERRVSRLQWGTFITAMVIATLDGLDLQAMALAAPAVAREWGVAPTVFSAAFTATPLGMVVGALTLGPVADGWGRKWPVIIATVLFGVFSLLTAFAPSLAVMALCRFLMGLGTGGILPNLIALVSEYAPARRRGALTTLTFSALPFGSMAGGLLAGWLIPELGWRSMFYVGGLVPLLIAAWSAVHLPESLRFLAARGGREREIAALLKRIDPQVSFAAGAVFTVPDHSSRRVSIALLFGPGRTVPTVLITLVAALNTFMLYFLLSWLPTVMKLAGLSTRAALLSTVLPNVGGVVGAIVLGRLIDRFGGFKVTSLGALVAGVASLVVGFGYSRPVILIPALFFAGSCVMGAQPALYVVIASLYPTTLRSTGTGFALGAGRVGSFIGPIAGGLALSRGWSVLEIFAMAAAPGFGAALALAWLARSPRDFVAAPV
ncbi:MAG TPA: MFS transporter [Steroidobacteraceae bacterium]|nr:MFS transporter [Steroidobacteraceae bacterium]